ncbi:hypothetical protein HDU88_008230 [Geranomyces variabilis]|nr:hypothetical protein HDU88_008230 [Geranomyces variabilis]
MTAATPHTPRVFAAYHQRRQSDSSAFFSSSSWSAVRLPTLLVSILLVLARSPPPAAAQSSSSAAAAAAAPTPAPGLAAAAAAAPSCLRLSNTQTCPGQESRLVLTSRFYNSTSSFDVFIATQNYDSSPAYISSFATAYQCPTYSGLGQRYHISFYCAWLVEASKSSCPDNNVNASGVDQRRLCQDTCLTARDSLSAVFANGNVCTQSTATGADSVNGKRQAIVDRYTALCATLPTTTDCDPGSLAQEINTCGFFSAAEARDFCKAQPTELCCARVMASAQQATIGGASPSPSAGKTTASSAATGLPLVMLVGIIAGCVVAVTLLVAFLIRKRRVQARKENKRRANVPRLPALSTATASLGRRGGGNGGNGYANGGGRTRAASDASDTSSSAMMTPRTSSPLISSSSATVAMARPPKSAAGFQNNGMLSPWASSTNSASSSSATPTVSPQGSFPFPPTASLLSPPPSTPLPSLPSQRNGGGGLLSPSPSPYADSSSYASMAGTTITRSPFGGLGSSISTLSPINVGMLWSAAAEDDAEKPHPHQQRNGDEEWGSSIAGSSFTAASSMAPAAAAAAAASAAAANSNRNSTARTMRVWAEYVPILDDELELRVGDEVEITETFSDGWASGVQVLKPSTIGVFPLACLVAPTISSPRDGRSPSVILSPRLGRAASMNWGQRERTREAVRIN